MEKKIYNQEEIDAMRTNGRQESAGDRVDPQPVKDDNYEMFDLGSAPSAKQNSLDRAAQDMINHGESRAIRKIFE